MKTRHGHATIKSNKLESLIADFDIQKLQNLSNCMVREYWENKKTFPEMKATIHIK